MALRIYRRHYIECHVHKLKLPAKAKKYYADCDCKIWITGTTDTERFPRQATGLTDWKAAEAYVKSLVAKSKDVVVHGETLGACVEKFLDAHRENVTDKVLGQHKLVLSRLEAFAKTRNKLFIRELTVDLLEDFKTYGLPEIKKSTSKSTAVSKLKFFLREAYRRGWTTEALAEKVKSTRAVYDQKLPYKDKEVPLILKEAEKLNGGTTGYATNGKTFRLLLELMLQTGMRVGDAIQFDPARCSKSKVLWIYHFQPQKQKKDDKPKQAEVFLTTKLKVAIDECEWMSEKFPFAYRPLSETTEMTGAVRERMLAIGERCGVEDCRPHRLRDTFAVRMLLKGIGLEDVSHLLCHSSVAITEKYYAAWVPSRKLRLGKLLSEALVNPVSR
jgi:integrase/recombinase XerD